MQTRNRKQPETKEGFTIETLYAVFGYGDYQMYVPFKCCHIYQHGSGISTTAPSAMFGLKRPHYSVYVALIKLTLYKTGKHANRKLIPYSSINFTNDEKKVIIPLSSCAVLAPYFDGQKFTCKLDELVLSCEPGSPTFMFKDLFFHEEFTPITYVTLKKNKKMQPIENVYEIERTAGTSSHSTMYT